MSSFFLSFDPISRLIKSFPEVSFFFLEIYVQRYSYQSHLWVSYSSSLKKKFLKFLEIKRVFPDKYDFNAHKYL